MRHETSRRRRSTFVPQTTVVPDLRQPAASGPRRISEEEVAAKFSATVLRYSKNDLSEISGRTPEAAKHWKAASRAPNSSSLINLARELPVVRDWLLDEIGVPVGSRKDDPSQDFNTMMVSLQLAANLPGQEGVMAKALLRKFTGGA